jgi:hypothetical protein
MNIKALKSPLSGWLPCMRYILRLISIIANGKANENDSQLR